MKNFAVKFLLVTMAILIFSTVIDPMLSYANDETFNFEEEFFNTSELEELTLKDYEELTDDELNELGYNTDEEFAEFNEEILNDDFDIEAAVDNLDIATMENEERETFLKLIEETAKTSGTDEIELLEQTFIDFFNSESEVFNDVEAAQDQLIDNYVAKIESNENYLVGLSKKLFGVETAQAKKKKGKIAVGQYLTGHLINLAIGGVVGGGTSAVKAYIKKKGKKKAAEGLSRVATAQAKKMGIEKIRNQRVGVIVTVAVDLALEYADIGQQISKQIEKRDWYPGNEWIDITK